MPQHRLRLITAGWQSVCNVCESNCSQSELDCNCLETGCSDPEVDTVACPSSGWPVGCCSYLQPLDGQWLIFPIHKEVVILSLSRYPLQTTASPIWKRMKKIKTHNYFSSVAQNKTNTTGLSKLKTIRQQCEYFQNIQQRVAPHVWICRCPPWRNPKGNRCRFSLLLGEHVNNDYLFVKKQFLI